MIRTANLRRVESEISPDRGAPAVGRTEPDQQPSRPVRDDDGDLGQTLLVGALILLFLVAVGGLVYLMLIN